MAAKKKSLARGDALVKAILAHLTGKKSPIGKPSTPRKSRV
jgi:hypothetical protein